jgi:4-hydroxythreonine-4-phosphate dehydrogenase
MTAADHRGVLAVTMGDPAGIGPDITLAAWANRVARELPPFAVYADIQMLRDRAAMLGLYVPFEVFDSIAAVGAAFDRVLPVIATPCASAVVAGQPSHVNAAATLSSIDRAAADVTAERASALVTNPIAKNVLYAAGFRHPGHTEYLAHLTQLSTGASTAPRPVMMLAAEELRVVPATIHIPIAAVPQALTADLLRETIVIMAQALARDFGVSRPRIAVAGLNPHAGENGTIGREDIDLIAPVITELRARGYNVTGPHSADTLFHASARARYDAVVCMYHDQALIPIKTLAFDRGVNVTLGLPFVRTSPDHGTAFDIAGKGVASPESLVQALLMAERMVASRLAYDAA